MPMILYDLNHFLLSPSTVRDIFQKWLNENTWYGTEATVTDVAQRSDGSIRVVVKAAEGPGLERGNLQNLFDPANPSDPEPEPESLKDFVEGVASVRKETEREAQIVEDLTAKIRKRNQMEDDD